MSGRDRELATLLMQLDRLGLSKNEARAYLTLLEDDSGQGLTGYEVAARSGVPRSAVYTVLRKLEDSGAAFEFGNNPARFVATEPERFIGGLRDEAEQHYAEALAALETLPPQSRPEPVWIVRRYEDVMHRMEQMIRNAEQAIYLSVWERELERISGALEEAEGRDLHRVIHSPGAISSPPRGFACWFQDTPDDAKSTWTHRVILVVDRREALIGGAEPAADNQAVFTTNPSLVDVATNHIVLDITLMARERGVDPTDDVAPMMAPHALKEP